LRVGLCRVSRSAARSVLRARETEEVGYALEGIHGSVQVRWELYTRFA
jgi:hypothetical protein